MFMLKAFVLICNFVTLCRHDDRLIISLIQIRNDEQTEFFYTIGKECDKRRRRKNSSGDNVHFLNLNWFSFHNKYSLKEILHDLFLYGVFDCLYFHNGFYIC